jgi:glucokinase
MRYCIGIDLGGTSIKFGVFESSGQLVEKWQKATDTTDSGRHVLTGIADMLHNKLTELGIHKAQVRGIGIGVPGLVTGKGQVSLAVNLGWSEVLVSEELSGLTGFPVRVTNDANAAALGEMWQGSGRGYKNLVMITLGTGIGGGVIIEEQIVQGLFGAAGEIGHIPIVYNETEICRCGRKGCLEQVASATGIAREARRLLSLRQQNGSILAGNKNISAYAVIEAAKAGDEVAREVMERATGCLGMAMATITGIIDPELYLIGGGVSGAGDYLLELIRKHYKEQVLSQCRNTEIKLASLGNDAGIYGAARLVLQQKIYSTI